MKRTQISLDAEQRATLDRVSRRTGRSMSALIRDAIEATYGESDDAERDLAAMQRARGTWRRSVDGATWVERVRSGSRLAARDENDGSSTPQER